MGTLGYQKNPYPKIVYDSGIWEFWIKDYLDFIIFLG